MLKNALLQQAAANIQQGVQDKDAFERLMKAGTKTIYSKGTFRALSQQLRKSKDLVDDVAKGIVAVLGIMAHRARGTIPQGPLMQAGMMLMLDALDFLEQAGLLKVDNATLDRATEEYVEALLPAVGLSRQKMDQVLGQIKAVMADPQKMAAYKQSLGGAKNG